MKTLTRTLAAVLTIAWPFSTAGALDITFDDVASVGNPAVAVLDTHGYRFTGAFRTIDAAGDPYVSNGSRVYLGDEAEAPGITVTRSDGGAFALYGFDAAALHVAPAAGSSRAQQVALLGLRIGGGLLQASFTFSDLPGFAPYPVPGYWHDLREVTFAGLLADGTLAALALDDVSLGEGPTSVAEPGTLSLLLLTGLAGGTVALARCGREAGRRRH